MLIRFLRIPITAAICYLFYRSLTSGVDVLGGGIIAAMVFGLFGVIAVTLLWAPVVGDKLSEPITGTFIQETSIVSVPRRLVQTIGRLQARGHHRMALVLILLEGIRHPELPHPALLGLRSAKPGSFLERWFAREIWGFSNIQNCLTAYTILKERHRITPPAHRLPEVNLAILSLTRERPPTPSPIPIKAAPLASKPPRNRRIRLFSR